MAYIPRLADIISQIKSYHKSKEKIVLVTGVFDLLHTEHIAFLHKAKKVGDRLIVALESDVRVKQLKGPTRPINKVDVRVDRIRRLQVADSLFVLPEQFSRPVDHENLIKTIRPDILAVSSHTKHLDKKRAILKKYGGKVEIVHPHNPLISTTAIVSKGQVGGVYEID